MNEPASRLPSKDSIRSTGTARPSDQEVERGEPGFQFGENDKREIGSPDLTSEVLLSNNANEFTQRREIERLSGWRLTAFLISASINLGLLLALVVLPLIMNPTRLFFITAIVSASHCVFLIAVAGFRFRVSAKIALGFAHAAACLWALSSVNALPTVQLGRFAIATMYLIPMLTMMVTIGGVVVARLTGYHRLHRFSVSDVLLLVTAFAILFPSVLAIVPWVRIAESFSIETLKPAFAFAAVGGISCLLATNLYVKFIPLGELGTSPLMVVVGWFLLLSMFEWTLCQFGFLMAAWVLGSLLPVFGRFKLAK